MNYLAKQYWISDNLSDHFSSTDLQILFNRGYEAKLELSSLRELGLKVILCTEEECAEVVAGGYHHYCLCFVLTQNEIPQTFPIGKEALFFIDSTDLQPFSDVIKLYEERTSERLEVIFQNQMDTSYHDLLQVAQKVLPPRGRSLNKEYQAIYSHYLSWAPVFLGAENGESFSKLVTEKAYEIWPELELKVLLKRAQAYQAILDGQQVTTVNDLFLSWNVKGGHASPSVALIVVLHLELVHAYSTDERKREKIVKASSFWEDVLDRLVDPVALLSSEGDLLICNHAFSKAGFLPKECLRLGDGETTQKNDQYFNVTKRSLLMGSDERIFILLESEQVNPSTQASGKGASEELGIISSSLAHELKNPIAGILAASSVLAFQENIGDETMGQIEEMKQSAKRCQNLIEIFLGFSKVETPHGHQTSMEGALSQAFELLKFRMIETHVRLEWSAKRGQEYLWDVNSSVASMVFYLILSEVMTYAAHGRLVANQNSDFCIALESSIDNDHITLKVNPSIEGMIGLKGHKLLGHLLEWEALQLVVEDDGITLVQGGN